MQSPDPKKLRRTVIKHAWESQLESFWDAGRDFRMKDYVERGACAIGGKNEPRRSESYRTSTTIVTTVPLGLKSLRETSSFAPLGLDHFYFVPTAYAVGFILSPLRGSKPLALFHPNLQSEVSRSH